jgi:hypothetical protein
MSPGPASRDWRPSLLEGYRTMKLRIPALLTLAIALFGSVAASAGEKKTYWGAASSNAIAITSDVELGASKLSIGYIDFPINKAKEISLTEAMAAFDVDTATPGAGTLYHINIAASTRFQHNNTLCGGEDVLWMLAWTTKHSLKLAFFSGADQPQLTFEAVSKSQDLCGVFTYTR